VGGSPAELARCNQPAITRSAGADGNDEDELPPVEISLTLRQKDHLFNRKSIDASLLTMEECSFVRSHLTFLCVRSRVIAHEERGKRRALAGNVVAGVVFSRKSSGRRCRRVLGVHVGGGEGGCASARQLEDDEGPFKMHHCVL